VNAPVSYYRLDVQLPETYKWQALADTRDGSPESRAQFAMVLRDAFARRQSLRLIEVMERTLLILPNPEIAVEESEETPGIR
jgi:hypothetical protein